jgi:hypothetical protein
VTGATPTIYGGPDNAGAGLFFTRRLSWASEGYFAIGSGDAMFRTSLAQRPVADDELAFGISRYPGTVVSVDFGLERGVRFAEFLAATSREFTKMTDEMRERVASRVRFT